MDSLSINDLSVKIQQITGFEIDHIEDKIPVLEISKTQLVRVLTILRTHNELEFLYFIDLLVIDYPENDKRFELNYFIRNITTFHCIDIRICLEEDESIDSITSIYPAAQWYECEAWEFFGIIFQNNHKLHHLILQEGYDDFPLKK